MVDTEMAVTEGVGKVAVTIQRSGDLTPEVQVYCYIAAGNVIKLMQGVQNLLCFPL